MGRGVPTPAALPERPSHNRGGSRIFIYEGGGGAQRLCARSHIITSAKSNGRGPGRAYKGHGALGGFDHRLICNSMGLMLFRAIRALFLSILVQNGGGGGGEIVDQIFWGAPIAPPPPPSKSATTTTIYQLIILQCYEKAVLPISFKMRDDALSAGDKNNVTQQGRYFLKGAFWTINVPPH